MRSPTDTDDALDGTVALVTGASSGIGERCARTLAASGARVVLVARRRERLDALMEELPWSYAVAADVSVPGTAGEVVADVERNLGQLDIVVNAAGTTRNVPASKETLEDFTAVLDVNLRATFAMCTAALPLLRVAGGSVVNITSILAQLSEPSLPEAGYVASKAGTAAMTRELAVQWARYGIRVNNLAPGWFPTDMTEALTHDPQRAAEFLARRVPMRRFGNLAELDGPLLLLASPTGSYITGQTIVVDGGASLI